MYLKSTKFRFTIPDLDWFKDYTVAKVEPLYTYEGDEALFLTVTFNEEAGGQMFEGFRNMLLDEVTVMREFLDGKGSVVSSEKYEAVIRAVFHDVTDKDVEDTLKYKVVFYVADTL